MYVFHDSRNLEYRTPFGAARTGEEISLSIVVKDMKSPVVYLRTWEDSVGESLIEMDGAFEADGFRFETTLCIKDPKILWYFFIIQDSYGEEATRFYGPTYGKRGGAGALYDNEPPSYQITVYKERIVPDWYKNGIIYQIFPDRFAKGEKKTPFEKREPRHIDELLVPGRRKLRNWDSAPFYEKDEEGRILYWDFYGGTLYGIAENIDYLKELGVTCLYLNPIFSAASNHRYDTANYLTVDETLGGIKGFEALLDAANKAGINIILDGVFNHTGCDSLYFNKYGNFMSVGAYQSEDSPYRDWFCFNDDTADGYDSWWGVGDLPNVNEASKSFQKFIYSGEDSVVKTWIKKGVKGWRLDVADELPDYFIEGIKKAALSADKDSVVIGEVWEDASNKISYGQLRKYLLGTELDGVMNYPLRDNCLNYVLGNISAHEICENMMSLKENYPREAFYSGFNLIGSHDRARVLTILGNAPVDGYMSEEDKRDYKLPRWQRELAKKRLKMAVTMQMTMPGVPLIYYGDEIGMEGFSDPYNRGSFGFNKQDLEISEIYRDRIDMRRSHEVLVSGDFEPFCIDDDVYGYYRRKGKEEAVVVFNSNVFESKKITLRDINKNKITFELSPLDSMVFFI